MRITNEMSQRLMTQYLAEHSRSLYDLQAQVGSGKKVDRPSDDPTAYGRILGLRDDGARLDRFLANSQQLAGEYLTCDGILQQISAKLERVSEIVVSAGDSSLAPGDQQTHAAEIDLILEDLVGLANSQSDGSSRFAGLRSDSPAFTVTRDADGRITGVSYQGNTGVRQVELSDGLFAPANIAGADLAGEGGLFQTASVDLFADLIQLRDRLLAGENPAESETFTADPATDTLSVNKVYSTGCTVALSTDGTLCSGLAAERTYYVIKVSDTEIRLADSMADARAGVYVDLTDAGTGEHNIVQQSLADNERDLGHVLAQLSALGAREERLSVHTAFLQDLRLAGQEATDAVEAVDVAQAVTELTSRQVAYEAALRVTANLFDASLVNYL
jgi:flagellar hook-associated protein 3 FlgL